MKSILPLSLLALFLLGATSLLWPFKTHNTVVSPGLDRNRPAGQITEGVSVSEVIPASFFNAGAQASADCIALRFGTYMRRNQGSIEVTFGQQATGHRWVIDTSRLNDNAYVNLCLQQPIQQGQPFWVTITGIDGARDRSPTVWLSANQSRAVQVNDKPMPGWGLALRLAKSREVSVHDLMRLNHGVFIAGFVISILIGLILLWQLFPRFRQTP